jgi:hypothetical protein
MYEVTVRHLHHSKVGGTGSFRGMKPNHCVVILELVNRYRISKALTPCLKLQRRSHESVSREAGG